MTKILSHLPNLFRDRVPQKGYYDDCGISTDATVGDISFRKPGFSLSGQWGGSPFGGAVALEEVQIAGLKSN